jgi:esterase
MLHFRSYGEGYPLIILHGLFGSLDNWHTIGKRLSDRYHVFLVDQRNHGRSPYFPSHTYDDLADDLYIFMHEQHLDCAHIMGHSMGGTAAMQFSAQRGDMVNRLIVVDMAPRDYQPRHDSIFKAFEAADLSTFTRRKEIDEAFKTHLSDYAVRQYILKNITRDDKNKFRWKLMSRLSGITIRRLYPVLKLKRRF